MNRQTVHRMHFVLYSPQQLVASNGAGFWSNDLGWVEFESATRFSARSVPCCNLPADEGRDAEWIMWESDHTHFNFTSARPPCQTPSSPF